MVKDERLLAFRERVHEMTDEELAILEDAVQARVDALKAGREVAGDSADRFARLLAWEKARLRIIKEEKLRRATGMELPPLP